MGVAPCYLFIWNDRNRALLIFTHRQALPGPRNDATDIRACKRSQNREADSRLEIDMTNYRRATFHPCTASSGISGRVALNDTSAQNADSDSSPFARSPADITPAA